MSKDKDNFLRNKVRQTGQIESFIVCGDLACYAKKLQNFAFRAF